MIANVSFSTDSKPILFGQTKTLVSSRVSFWHDIKMTTKKKIFIILNFNGFKDLMVSITQLV
jgi:uncharacterized protein YpiB (UPF0302 family)